MIKFSVIRWKNLLSTGNEFIEIRLDKSMMTLIVGENGAGKSTFLEALTFVLFSKPFRKINKPQLVNSMTKKNLLVEVEFTVGPNAYKVVRGLRPNIFEIYMNGALMNQSAESKDYQEVLEKHILKVNYKSFCQVVVLGSASYVPFMQLPAGQRREIIEDLLDLQVFTTMNQILKDKLSLNNMVINESEAKRVLINEKIKMVKKHSAEREENDRRIIEDRETAIESTQNQIVSASKKRTTALNNIETLLASIGDEQAAANNVTKMQRLKRDLEIKVDNLRHDVNFLSNNTTCPTCAQEIDPEFRETHVHEKNGKIVTITGALPDLVNKLDQAQDILKQSIKTHNKINEIRVEVSTYDNQIKMYEEYIARTRKEIEDMKNRTRTINTDDLTELETQLQEVEKKLTGLLEDSEVMNLSALMLKDGGIKSKIVKQYIPIMNKFINKYLSTLDFFVQFELNESFEETIKSRFRDAFSYESFSEGEKMRLNLAILFAWRAIAKLRNSINTNILVLDEVFDSSLDVNGTDEFMKMLNGLTEDTNTFIISHKTDAMVDKFDNILRFTKVKNFSKMVA